MLRTRVSLWDVAAIALVLLLSGLLIVLPLLWSGDGAYLEISTPEGSWAYSLREDREIRLHSRGIELVVRIESGTAYVSTSDCPDGVCVASGRISRSGETVICAPAGVRLLVKGGDADVDFVAG